MSLSREGTEPGRRGEGAIRWVPESDSDHSRCFTQDSHVKQEWLTIAQKSRVLIPSQDYVLYCNKHFI